MKCKVCNVRSIKDYEEMCRDCYLREEASPPSDPLEVPKYTDWLNNEIDRLEQEKRIDINGQSQGDYYNTYTN